MIRLGVVGDIHGNRPALQEALGQMGSVDQLLFTGDGSRDFNSIQTGLQVPIVGVAGNCDFCTLYPDEQVVVVANHKILLTHGHRYGVKQGLTRLALAGQAAAVELVVFGHTHLPMDAIWQNVHLFNPGSLSRERAIGGLSYGLIELDAGGIRTRLCRL
jgi:putative phosphoesterase